MESVPQKENSSDDNVAKEENADFELEDFQVHSCSLSYLDIIVAISFVTFIFIFCVLELVIIWSSSSPLDAMYELSDIICQILNFLAYAGMKQLI